MVLIDLSEEGKSSIFLLLRNINSPFTFHQDPFRLLQT